MKYDGQEITLPENKYKTGQNCWGKRPFQVSWKSSTGRQ